MEESIPFLRHFFFKRWNDSKSRTSIDEETLREYEANNKAILQEIEVIKYMYIPFRNPLIREKNSYSMDFHRFPSYGMLNRLANNK